MKPSPPSCTTPQKTRAAANVWTTSARASAIAVARIVEDCTDSFSQPKEPWLERKQAYIQHARKLSGPSLRVSAADKVHNSYAILRDLRNSGERVWARFQATPDDVLAYYESLVRAYREAGGGLLVDELDRIVRGIQREMGY